MLTPEIKLFLSVVAIIIGFVWYYPYLRDIFLWKTKPHAFSWLIWGVLGGIGFAVQIVEKWGFASWSLGTTSLTCLLISVIGFIWWDRKFHWVDWVSLVAAGISIIVWRWTNNPLYSVLVITLIDVLGSVPTFRKTWNQPESETLALWYALDVKMLLGIVALTTYSINTVLYPFTIFLMNTGVIAIIHIRRRQQLSSTKIYRS